MTTSDDNILSVTSRTSSFITHLPGVLDQQQKQPRQGSAFRFLTVTVSVSISAEDAMPSMKAFVIRIVLLFSPRGLPFIIRTFKFLHLLDLTKTFYNIHA